QQHRTQRDQRPEDRRHPEDLGWRRARSAECRRVDVGALSLEPLQPALERRMRRDPAKPSDLGLLARRLLSFGLDLGAVLLPGLILAVERRDQLAGAGLAGRVALDLLPQSLDARLLTARPRRLGAADDEQVIGPL